MTVTCTIITHESPLPAPYALVFHDETGRRIAHIDNLEATYDQLTAFAAAVNEGALEEIHLYDVLDDAITGWRHEAGAPSLPIHT